MDTSQKTPEDRKPYNPPAVIYEATLEARAGTPTGIVDPLDLFGTGQK
jgi:hypothetical protein